MSDSKKVFVTRLRERMLGDLQLRGMAERTQDGYLREVKHTRRSATTGSLNNAFELRLE